MFVMTTLGNLVRERRQYLGLTQEELARLVPAKRSSIESIENGRVIQPSVPMLNQLASALRIPVEELLQAEGYALQAQAESVAEAEAKLADELYARFGEIVGRFRRRPPTAENG